MNWHDYLQVLTPALITLLLAAFTAVGAWLRMKTRHWEAMNKETQANAREAKEYSEESRKILEENTILTKEMVKNTGKQFDEAKKLSNKAAFKAGRIQGRLEQSGSINSEELEKLEAEFHEVITPRRNGGTE